MVKVGCHILTGEQQRRIVFFLGAGASFGAGARAQVQGGGAVPIPTQQTFWETFLRFCARENNRKLIEAFLFRYFLGYDRVPARSSASARRKQLTPINVEEVFTFLSERNNAPGVPSQFQSYTTRVWNALLEEIGRVFSHFTPNSKTRSVYREFISNHVRTRDTIVSFNYDVVFEYSLAGNRPWYYEGIDPTHLAQSLRILKPHGSINWAELNGTIEARHYLADFPAHPIVVAPTHLKFIGTGARNEDGSQKVIGYLNQSEQVAKVWSAMEREMKEAKAWVFVGYSFPPSDLYFSSVLRSTLAVRPSYPFVVVVNPDSMDISRRLHDRFAIFNDKIKTFSDLQTFNQVTRAQILRMF